MMMVLIHRKSSIPHFTQLIRRRWEYTDPIGPSILRALEIDAILRYLASKPKIADPSSIRTMFQFKRKFRTSHDEAMCVITCHPEFAIEIIILFLKINAEFSAPKISVRNWNLMPF